MWCARRRHQRPPGAAQPAGVESGRGDGVDGTAVRLAARLTTMTTVLAIRSWNRPIKPSPRTCSENDQPAIGGQHPPNLGEAWRPHHQPSTAPDRHGPSRNCCPGTESTHPTPRRHRRRWPWRRARALGHPPHRGIGLHRGHRRHQRRAGTTDRFPGRPRPSTTGRWHGSSPSRRYRR